MIIFIMLGMNRSLTGGNNSSPAYCERNTSVYLTRCDAQRAIIGRLLENEGRACKNYEEAQDIRRRGEAKLREMMEEEE